MQKIRSEPEVRGGSAGSAGADCRGNYLRYLELYAASPKSREYYHLLVYDENNEMLINRDFELTADEVPGFVRIPLGIDTTRGTAYV